MKEMDFLSYCWQHLSILPLRCCRFECASDWRLLPRQLDHPYFTCWESGYARLRLGLENYELKGGELVVFPRGIEHEITPVDHCPCTMINLHFQALINGATDLPGLLGVGGVYTEIEGASGKNFREFAAIDMAGEPGGNEYLRAMIQIFLWRLARLRADIQAPPDWKRMLPALEYIATRYSDPDLSTPRLAKILGLSEVYVRQLFRRQFGISPMQYAGRVRIERAKSLLMKTVLPNKEIALQCGFQDMNFFYRVFKRQTGHTPSEYRDGFES